MLRRALQLFLVVGLALTFLGADDSTTRLESIGHKLVCQCGCTQILMECNHVGCPVSPVMISELRTQLASGAGQSAALDFFIGKYGPIVLAAPIRGGFDNVAWIVPIATAVLGGILVLWLMRVWKRRRVPLAEGFAAAPPSLDPLDPLTAEEQLRERIRRETDYDSWGDKR